MDIDGSLHYTCGTLVAAIPGLKFNKEM